jgi:hypothetical protein
MLGRKLERWRLNHFHVPIRRKLSANAYKASIAIRIMSDTRDEEKDRNKDQRIKGVLQDTQDPRNNRYIYNHDITTTNIDVTGTRN